MQTKLSKRLARQGAKTVVTLVVALVFVFSVSYLQATFSYPAVNPPSGNVSAAINLSTAFQNKTGGFEALSIGVSDGISLNGISRTTAKGWPVSDVMAECRMESRRFSFERRVVTPIGNRNLTYVPDQYPKCDDFLTPEARADGWTASGGDACEGVTNHDCASIPTGSGCVYVRMVCDAGINVTKPIAATSTWVSSPFTVPTAQCADGINNDTPLLQPWAFVSTPTVAPYYYGRQLAISSTMDYFMFNDDYSPVTNMYKRNAAGSDIWTRLTTGAQGMGMSVEPNTSAAVFAVGDQFYIAASWTTPYLHVFERTDTTFNRLVPPTNGPNIALPNVANDVDVYEQGNDIYIAVAHYSNGASGSRVSMFKRTGASSRSFVNLPSAFNVGPSTVGSTAKSIDFSPDGTYIAVTTDVTPFLTIYKRNTTDTWTKLLLPSGINTIPAGQGEGVKFSADGTYLAVHHLVTPFFSIYKRNGDQFNLLIPANGEGLNIGPVNAPYNVWGPSYQLGASKPSFSPDGTYLALVDYSASTPNSLLIYQRSGDSFTKMSSVLHPMTNVYSAQFTSDSQYLIAGYGSPGGEYLAVLKKDLSGDTLVDFPADPQCGSIYDETEKMIEACSDGANNDGDGYTDYPFDPECTSSRDTSE